MSATELSAALPAPEGFRAVDLGPGFVTNNAQLYGRWADEKLALGFRVEARLANLAGSLHGGMLASFADTFLPYAVMYQSLGKRRIMPTINLQIDYVAPAMMGSWVHGEATVLRVTRTIAFVQGLAFADGEVIARASGIFKLGNHIEGGDGDFFGLKSVS
jgi:uncharacterized protein (TIGR00369 family)